MDYGDKQREEWEAKRRAAGGAVGRNTPTVIPTTGLCASCSFPVVRLLGPETDANAWALRASAIEQAARDLEEGLDAQDLPAGKREALLRLRVALADRA